MTDCSAHAWMEAKGAKAQEPQQPGIAISMSRPSPVNTRAPLQFFVVLDATVTVMHCAEFGRNPPELLRAVRSTALIERFRAWSQTSLTGDGQERGNEKNGERRGEVVVEPPFNSREVSALCLVRLLSKHSV